MPLDLIQTELGQDRLELTERVVALNSRFRHHSAHDVMHGAIEEIDELALVSSLGAESVVLLHMVAVADKATPILFIDTQMLFTETLEYQHEISERLGLKNVRIIRADEEDVERSNPYGALHLRDTDACCNLRKTFPLQRALSSTLYKKRSCSGPKNSVCGDLHQGLLNGQNVPSEVPNILSSFPVELQPYFNFVI